jgi:AbrB family looped-hinge helix DNA binding protein
VHVNIKVYRKGIVAPPTTARQRLRIREGSRLTMEAVGDTIVLKRKFTLPDALGVDDGESGVRLVKDLQHEERRQIEKENSGSRHRLLNCLLHGFKRGHKKRRRKLMVTGYADNYFESQKFIPTQNRGALKPPQWRPH